ncbi:MAG: M18 family aminopeptidase [Deltaproteobacteria bacterium]|jgi:aspartyl aminopeptidase|nr:M18 family aminopeptidase [Deltaproteobacteria bacterium]
MTASTATALDLVRYIDASPTPWHCARTSADRLLAAGFTALDESAPFAIAPGEGGFYLRDGLVVAFRLGTRPPVESGFRLLGAHTDSPNLRLKPQPEVVKAGFRTLGVEVYGGALYYTWLDRDLGLAGRVFLKTETPFPESRLIHLARPLCRIPSLAIHLNREVNTDGLKLNAQQHLAPMFAMPAAKGDETSALKRLLADAAEVEPERLISWDLALVDTQPSTLGGLDDAFVFAPRLDNQASCHAALSALIAAPASEATQVVALYDHEEVGSLTTAGADGPLVELLLKRLALGTPWGGPLLDTAPARHAPLLDTARHAPLLSESEAFQRAIAKSWHISADMAHAVHPNFEDRHEPQHKPVLNGGPVIKSNSNQRYATNGETAALFESLCLAAEVPVQKFVTRTDLACGTTIGPIAGGKLGVRTVDVGNPMLSMHSAREQCGAHDVSRMISVMTRFLGV